MLFRTLRAVTAFRKKHLPFLRSLEDVELMHEVGYRQEEGRPISVKELHELRLAPVPTLQRRLRRLTQAGALVARRAERDARLVELTISPKVLRIYSRYGEFFVQHRRGHD